jgi:hypothetical protein
VDSTKSILLEVEGASDYMLNSESTKLITFFSILHCFDSSIKIFASIGFIEMVRIGRYFA